MGSALFGDAVELFGQAADGLVGDAEMIATDLLAQAEHGSGHERVWMVTTSARLLQDVDREIDKWVKIIAAGNIKPE